MKIAEFFNLWQIIQLSMYFGNVGDLTLKKSDIADLTKIKENLRKHRLENTKTNIESSGDLYETFKSCFTIRKTNEEDFIDYFSGQISNYFHQQYISQLVPQGNLIKYDGIVTYAIICQINNLLIEYHQSDTKKENFISKKEFAALEDENNLAKKQIKKQMIAALNIDKKKNSDEINILTKASFIHFGLILALGLWLGYLALTEPLSPFTRGLRLGMSFIFGILILISSMTYVATTHPFINRNQNQTIGEFLQEMLTMMVILALPIKQTQRILSLRNKNQALTNEEEKIKSEFKEKLDNYKILQPTEQFKNPSSTTPIQTLFHHKKTEELQLRKRNTSSKPKKSTSNHQSI